MIVRAIDAMFVWTPDRDRFASGLYPLKGKIAATTIPESAANKQHPMSWGACNADWVDTDDAGRLRMAQRLVSELIHQDNIPEAEVRKAFAQVDEFATFPFHTLPP